MNTLDTRDLYKRQHDLKDLKAAVDSALDELDEAQNNLEAHPADGAAGGTEEEKEAHSEKTEELEEAVSDAQTALDDAQAEFGANEQEELAELDNLESKIGREWKHGEQMIPESEFEDYARELAEEIGGMDDAKWPFTCIDWEKAADELKQDYTSVSYQGEDCYVCS